MGVPPEMTTFVWFKTLPIVLVPSVTLYPVVWVKSTSLAKAFPAEPLEPYAIPPPPPLPPEPPVAVTVPLL